MAGLYDLLISNAAAQSRTAPPAPSIKDTVEPAPPMTADEIDLATSGEAALGASAGVSQVKGMVKGALAATADMLSAPKFGQAMRTSANADMAEAQQVSSYSSAPQSLKDVGGVGDFLDYARFGVAKQAPQLGAMAGAALVGGGAGVTAMGVGMNAGAQYLDGNAEIDELRAQNLVTPEREAQLRSQVLEKSGIAGVIMGALDRIGFGAVAPRLVGGVAASLPRQVLKAMGQEGGTELVQEYVGNVATKMALERPDEFGITQDEMWQLADAGVLGGLTGGAMAVPGGSFSRVGQGIDKAVDLAGAAVNRFRPDDNAAAGGVAPTPEGPAGPSAGGRLGMALRGLIDTDPEVVKQAAGQQFDQLMQNEYVQRAVQEGKDLLGELRQSSRLQKLDAFEQQVADGFKQFTDAFGDRAQTDNIEAAYARYKEMLARSGIDFSKVDPAKAGNAAGAAVAGFNDWLGRTEYAAQSIFKGAQEGFNNPGENRTTFGDTTYEAAAQAGEAARAATDFAKAATDTVGRYAKAGAGMAKDAFKAAAEAMRKDVGPIEGAEYTVDTIAGQLQRPTGKQSVVAGRDVKLVEDTFRQLGVKDGDAVRFIARRLAPMLTDRKVFDSFMSSQATIDAFKNDLGLYPHQVASLLYLNLRENGMDTEAESLGYMGMPPAESTLNEVYGKQQDEAGPQLAEDQVDPNNDVGVSEVEQQTLADAKAEVGNDRIGALQNKALAPGEAAKAAFERMQAGTFRGAQGSQRWVVKTRTVKDPATGAVLEQTSEPVKINMMDVAMAESGARSRRPNETKQQRKDADWMSGIASVFNGWQETDEQGRTVEVTVQPGKQTSVVGPDGKKVDSAEPVDTPLNEWIRPREVVGAGERTFDRLQQENRANKPLTGLPVAVEQYVTGIQAAQENGVKDLLGYEMTLINAAVDAVREARFPQDLRMAEATDLKAYERELETMVNFVDNVEPSPQVDGMWALLRDPTMPQAVKDVLLTNITRAIQADNIGAMDTSVSTPPEELRAKRRELLATPPSERGTESFVQGARDYALGVVNQVANALGDDNVYPAALTLLPSNIVKKQDESGMALITRRLFGAIRNSESIRNDTTSLTDNPTQPIPDQEIYKPGDKAGQPSNVLSGKGGLRMYDEEGPVTEDLAGQYIDYDAAEKAGREQGREAIRRREARKVKGMTPEQINIPPVRKKPRADAERSVVTAVREAAAPEVAAQGPKDQAGPSGSGKKRALYEGEGGLDLTTPEGRDEARRRIREIAGNVGITFGTENSYDPEGHLITLAVSRFADLGTAYHEAVHAIFKAIEANDKATLYAGLNTMHVRNQLKTLLRDSPAALEAALNDPEELAAYAFQFYKRGMLKLGPETATWLDKLVKVIEDVKNWLLDQPGHEELFQKIAEGYYKDGGPSPMELAALRESKGAARRIVSDTARGLLAVYDKLLSAVDDRLRAAGVSELTDIAKEFYTQVGEKTSRRGMAQEIPIMTNIWMNRLAKVLGDNAGVAAAALEEMALGNEDSPKAKELRTFLNQMRTYMKQAGVDIGYIQGYLPMQWSGDKIANDEDGFIAMLEKYTPQLKELGLTPQRAWAMMSQRNVSSAIPSGDVFDPDGKPTMWHSQERVFSFLSAEDRRPYVEDNLIGTLGQYVKQAVKRAEWERRFPGNSWEKALTAAEKRGAKPEDIAIAKDLKEAVFGAKYNRMNPTWRRVLGAVQTYQNVRVLGLSLFSSVADPLAIGVRTGDFKEAWNAFKYGMRHIYKAPQGELNQLAEDIGVVNELGNLDSLMTLYGGFEVEGNLKHVNDMLFKYNGLEGLTRGLRVYAAGAGVRFVQRANTRQLAELGLKSDDLKYMPDGTLAVRSSQFKELGATNQEAMDSALKMQRALNRFVDESILRPNAAERPKWANDPVFALLFHLKQFIFSFHKIVSKKVMHEIEEGNMEAGTYLSAAAFVPLMAATGYMKDLIQFAGTVPEDRDFMHYLVQGVNRSGFMGPSVLASDVGSDLMSGQNPIGSVGGPAVSQALEALQALANPDRFSGFVEEALPLSSIYKRWND